MVRSIVADEESDESAVHSLSLEGAEGLALVLDSRRCGLSEHEQRGGFTDQVVEEDGRFRLFGSFGVRFPRLLDGPVLATYEEDTEYTIGGYFSPYEEIGLRLVQLVEAREAERPGSAGRRAADVELRSFVTGIVLQTRGRPTDLREDAARRIVDEGERLVSLVLKALAEHVEVSERTRMVLTSFAVTPPQMVDWAVRLALPVFSRLEIDALCRSTRELVRRGDRGEAFAREFAVRLLAHRLRRPVAAIARKTTNGWKAEMMGASGPVCEICGVDHEA
jgi:hypothetical protein